MGGICYSTEHNNDIEQLHIPESYSRHNENHKNIIFNRDISPIDNEILVIGYIRQKLNTINIYMPYYLYTKIYDFHGRYFAIFTIGNGKHSQFGIEDNSAIPNQQIFNHLHHHQQINSFSSNISQPTNLNACPLFSKIFHEPILSLLIADTNDISCGYHRFMIRNKNNRFSVAGQNYYGQCGMYGRCQSIFNELGDDIIDKNMDTGIAHTNTLSIDIPSSKITIEDEYTDDDILRRKMIDIISNGICSSHTFIRVRNSIIHESKDEINKYELFSFGRGNCGQLGHGFRKCTDYYEDHTYFIPHKLTSAHFRYNRKSTSNVSTFDQKIVSPLEIYNAQFIVQIECGMNHTLFLFENGRVFGCGDNRYSQLGINHEYYSTIKRQWKFDLLSDPSKNSHSSSVYETLITPSLMSTTTDDLFYTTDRGLDEDDEDTKNDVPIIPNTNHSILHSIPNSHLFAVRSSSILSSAGFLQSYDEQHINAHKKVLLPLEIPYLKNIRSIKCGANHNLCIDDKYRLWVFGRNDMGQLGITTDDFTDNDIDDEIMDKYIVYQPVIHPYFMRHEINIESISAGFQHSGTIDIKGNLYLFGSNTHGQIGIGFGKKRMVNGMQHKMIHEIIIDMKVDVSKDKNDSEMDENVEYDSDISCETDEKMIIIDNNTIVTASAVIVDKNMSFSQFSLGSDHTLMLLAIDDGFGSDRRHKQYLYACGNNCYHQCSNFISDEKIYEPVLWKNTQLFDIFESDDENCESIDSKRNMDEYRIVKIIAGNQCSIIIYEKKMWSEK